MTFADFKDLVDDMMPADARRKGRSVSVYKTQMLRAALIDVQRLIEYYRTGHETLYIPSDLAIEGGAHRGRLPDGADLQEAWILQEDVREEHQISTKIPLRYIDWTERDAMVYTSERRLPNLSDPSSPFVLEEPVIPVGHIPPYLAVSPKGTEFYISPRLDGHALGVTTMTRVGSLVTVVTDDPHGLQDDDLVEILGSDQTGYEGEQTITRVDDSTFTFTISTSPATPATGTITWRRVTVETSLLLIWDGVKLTFEDADDTPFDEEIALVVSLYIRSRMEKIMRERAVAADLMQDYKDEKRKLYLDRKELTSVTRLRDRLSTSTPVQRIKKLP